MMICETPAPEALFRIPSISLRLKFFDAKLAPISMIGTVFLFSSLMGEMGILTSFLGFASALGVRWLSSEPTGRGEGGEEVEPPGIGTSRRAGRPARGFGLTIGLAPNISVFCVSVMTWTGMV